MKRDTQRNGCLRRSRIYVGLLFLLCVTGSYAAQYRLVFAADMPVIGDPQNGGYPQLASLLTETRQNGPTFFAFGGGSIGPSVLSAFDNGSHIIDILNSLEPDIMSVTKREFSYYEDELSLRSNEAAFPFVSSNSTDRLTAAPLDGIEPYVVVQKQGLSLGFISLLHESSVREYLLKRLAISNPIRQAKATANEVRQQGADLVILISSYPFDFLDELVADGTVDFILISDPHIELSDFRTPPTHENTLVVSRNQRFALLDIDYDPSKTPKAVFKTTFISIDGLVPDLEVQSQVNDYLNRLDRLLSEPLGTLTTEIDTRRPLVRGGESAFGNFIADSIRDALGTDVAIVNGGTIRGETVYPAGTTIYRRDIAKELPFRNKLAAVEVTGAQLLETLEIGVSRVEDLKGNFPQTSGMRIQYNPAHAPLSRIISVSINGQPLIMDKNYTVATTNYLASGGDGFVPLVRGRKIEDELRTTPFLSDTVIDAIKKQREVGPTTENRIVAVTK